MNEFTSAQLYRINLGKSIGIPYQLYADPGLSAERMNTILSALINISEAGTAYKKSG